MFLTQRLCWHAGTPRCTYQNITLFQDADCSLWQFPYAGLPATVLDSCSELYCTHVCQHTPGHMGWVLDHCCCRWGECFVVLQGGELPNRWRTLWQGIAVRVEPLGRNCSADGASMKAGWHHEG